MAPLLMFGAMFGMLFVVHGAAQQRAGASSRCSASPSSPGVMLTPILTVAAGLRNGGQLVALAGGMTAVDLLRDGGDCHGDEAGLLLSWASSCSSG